MEDSSIFRFYAIVTLDPDGAPRGVASTDLEVVSRGGSLYESFRETSMDGYGIATIVFDIEVENGQMRWEPIVARPQLLAPSQRLLDGEKTISPNDSMRFDTINELSEIKYDDNEDDERDF